MKSLIIMEKKMLSFLEMDYLKLIFTIFSTIKKI